MYWDQTGKYQVEYDRLYAKLVPRMGKAPTKRGELLRVASRLYYDIYNNGGGNIHDGALDDELKMLDTFNIPNSDIFFYKTIDLEIMEGVIDTIIERVMTADSYIEQADAETAQNFFNINWS